MATIFRLTMRQLTGRWRVVLILLLVSLPIGLAAIVSATLGEDETSTEGFTSVLLDALLIAGSLPIISMVLATAALGNEVEDRTLSYLVLKPISRWRIVLPKLLAVIAIGGPVLVAGGVIATVLGASDLGAVIVPFDNPLRGALAVGLALFAGVVAYSSIFVWAGLMTNRALGFGLMYVFIWEGLLGTFLDGIRYLSVRGYTLAILHGTYEDGFESLADRSIPLEAGLVGAAVVTIAFFLLTVRRLTQMDVP